MILAATTLGGAVPPVADPAPAPAPQPAAAPAPAAATPPAPTLLGGVQAPVAAAAATLLGGDPAPAPAAADPNAWLPEKFRVQEGDNLNFTASAQKLGEAYSQLEKRFGSGEARPADVAGYKFDLGDEFATAFLENDAAKQFMQNAFDLGLNNKQMNFLVNELVNAQPPAAETVTGYTAEQTRAALQETWKEPGDYQRNMLAADTAARNLLGNDYTDFIGRYGNDPAIIKMLSVVGREMSEDSLRLAGVPIISADSVEDLMRQPAYRDETHPDHKRVVSQVRTYFAKTYAGQNPV